MTSEPVPSARRLAQRAWLVLAAVLAAGLWLVRWRSAKAQYMGDSYSYARRSYEIAGFRQHVAGTKAAQVACQWLHHRVDSFRFDKGHPCLISPWPVRTEYAAIFRDRVGFAFLARLLMPVWQQNSFAIATALCAVVSALLLAWLAREAGLPRVTALVAVVFLFVVRDATWLARVGSEAPALVGILGTAVGLVRWSRAGWQRSWWIVFLSLGWLLAVRPSSAVVLSAAVLLVYGVSAIRRRGHANVGLAVVGGVTLAVEMLVMHLLQSPGLTETMRDVVTHHFLLHTTPGGIDTEFLRVERRTMSKLAVRMVQHPVVPLLALLGTWRTLRVPALRLPALCVVALALLSAIAHPVFTEVPRLLSPATSVEAIGLAILATSAVARLAEWLRSRSAAGAPTVAVGALE